MITDPVDRAFTIVIALCSLILGTSILATALIISGPSPWLAGLGLLLQPVVGMLRNAL